MYRILLIAALVMSMTAFANDPVTLDSPFQVRYAANLNIGESFINITNSGARGAGLASGTSASVTGAICANVYAFSPDEQLISCCSCPVTPNGLRSLAVTRDLTSNTLTGVIPSSVVIKLLATVPVGGSCNNSAAAPGDVTLGMLAWGTTLHPNTSPTDGFWDQVETPFVPATLSAGELSRITTLCNFILANGSGFGICRSCQLGGLGGAKRF